MKTSELTLDLALDAFWAKVQELHPERERANLPGPEQYDLENYARNAVDAWLVLNKPVFYVRRFVTQIIAIRGPNTPDGALQQAQNLTESEWANDSTDTECEYIVLGPNGEALT